MYYECIFSIPYVHVYIRAYHDVQKWSVYTGKGRKKGGIGEEREKKKGGREMMSEEVCLRH